MNGLPPQKVPKPHLNPSNVPSGYKVMNSLGCGYFGTVIFPYKTSIHSHKVWRAEVLEGKHKGKHVAVKMIELDKCADNKINDIRVTF